MAAYKEENKDTKAKFDELDSNYEYDAMYDLMIPFKDSNDPDLLWRLAYAASEKKSDAGKKEANIHVEEAFGYATRALELDEGNHECHKWYGLMLQAVGEKKAIKEQLADAFKIQKHFLRGLEICPTDPVLMHCLGMWCFFFADMKWYERKVASVVFSAPPTSTYEEALKYFEDAEKAKPGFYIPNQHMIATMLLKTKQDKERAKELLIAVAKSNARSDDEIESKKEAKTTLKKEFKTEV